MNGENLNKAKQKSSKSTPTLTGKNILIVHYPELYQEKKDVIAGIKAVDFRTKTRYPSEQLRLRFRIWVSGIKLI